MFYLISFHGNFYRDNEQTRPYQTYHQRVICNVKGQSSNHFEVLGKIPKPKVPASQTNAYIKKKFKLLIQILEANHKSASGSFELQKKFQKEKIFLSNDISKTRRFYEFILVDTESIQVSHVKNPEGTDIAYS